VAADLRRQHAQPGVHAGRGRHLRLARGAPDRSRGLPDAAPSPHRHRAVRRAGRPPGASPQRRGRRRGRPDDHRRAGRRAAARPAAAQRR
jgi:hypothetical protein